MVSQRTQTRENPLRTTVFPKETVSQLSFVSSSPSCQFRILVDEQIIILFSIRIELNPPPPTVLEIGTTYFDKNTTSRKKLGLQN